MSRYVKPRQTIVGSRVFRSSVALLLTLLLTGCTGIGTFGVTKSEEGLVVLSECSDAGVSSIKVGPDTGARESNGVYPTLTDITFVVDWRGDDRDAFGVVNLADPGPQYIVAGTHPDLDSDEAILIEARFQLGAVNTTQLIVPSTLREGFVRVPVEHEAGAYEFLALADFEKRLRECSPGSIRFGRRSLIALIIVVAGVGALVYGSSAAKRRRLPPPPLAR